MQGGHEIELMIIFAREEPDQGRKSNLRDRFSRTLRSFSRQAGAWRYQENGRSRSGPPEIRIWFERLDDHSAVN